VHTKIFRNGVRTLFEFHDLVGDLGSDEILAVDIYPRFGEVPSDYPVDALSPCGVLAIWTRPVDAPVKQPWRNR
jgi:hypothetical protein